MESLSNPARIYEIDGRDFGTLEEFCDVIGRVVTPGTEWGRNLNAFNDILRGGFGTPEDGFVIRWRNSDESRNRLGHAETVRQLEESLLRCHPTARDSMAAQLDAARSGTGPTVFDWLVEIIRRHGDGGSEAEDGVVLLLD